MTGVQTCALPILAVGCWPLAAFGSLVALGFVGRWLPLGLWVLLALLVLLPVPPPFFLKFWVLFLFFVVVVVFAFTHKWPFSWLEHSWVTRFSLKTLYKLFHFLAFTLPF